MNPREVRQLAAGPLEPSAKASLATVFSMVYKHMGKEVAGGRLASSSAARFRDHTRELHPLRLHKSLAQPRVASFALVNDSIVVTIVSSTKQLCAVQATAQVILTCCFNRGL
jgi:hypothetical protein